MKVLLVEDDVALHAVVCAVLEDAGHHAHCVRTVAEALAELASTHYDAVVLDWMLGEHTCEPLLEELSRRSPPMPTVIYSASPRARELAEEWSVGFVVKPFDVDALLDILASSVRDRLSPRPPSPS